jgi:hypothetical protein
MKTTSPSRWAKLMALVGVLDEKIKVARRDRKTFVELELLDHRRDLLNALSSMKVRWNRERA